MSSDSNNRRPFPRRTVVRTIAATLAAACLTACQRDGSAVAGLAEEPSRASSAVIGSSKMTPQLEIARHIAVALEDATARSALRDAIRTSSFQEHKLDLHMFLLNGPQRIRDVLAANRLEESDRMLLGRLGSMDLYFPIDGHVDSWAGGPVTVVTVSDPDAMRATVIDANGWTREVMEKDIPSLGHMLVIHPAERRSLRSVALLASLESSSTSACAGTSTDVRLTYFRIFRGDGPFGGANEMEFRGRQLDVNGVPGTGVTYAVGGIRTNRDHFPNVSLGCAGFFGASFSHQIWEMDGGSASPNQNDFFGSRTFPPTAYNFGAIYNDGSQDGGIATISNP